MSESNPSSSDVGMFVLVVMLAILLLAGGFVLHQQRTQALQAEVDNQRARAETAIRQAEMARQQAEAEREQAEAAREKAEQRLLDAKAASD